MPKSYPLDIENVGGDEYALMSRGHHDLHAFMREIRAQGYSWPLGVPAHKWVKTVPCQCGEHRCHYEFVNEGTRGAWPATYAWEAYGEDRYEAKFPAGAPAGEHATEHGNRQPREAPGG